MVAVATVQREMTDSKQNPNLATCQSETSRDASQNSKGCTVPPPSVFLHYERLYYVYSVYFISEPFADAVLQHFFLVVISCS